MKKSLKSKIVTGTIAVGLLSGVGAAFANTDAGEKLGNWYNTEFGKSTTTIVNSSTKHVTDQADSLQREYFGVRTGVTSKINGQKDESIKSSTDAISSKKKTYLDQVASKKSQISNQMAAQFDGILAYANSEINKAGNIAFGYANNDLSKLAKSNGDAALVKVEQDINSAKSQAVKDLEAAIASAKSELQSQLSSETKSTTEDINKAIDAKIAEVRGLINTKAQTLVDTQKGLIKAKATELENTAKTELDNVVNGI